jgi:hypothetical protein
MNEMLRIDWVNHCHKDMVTLLNFNVASIKIEVVIKCQAFTLLLLFSLICVHMSGFILVLIMEGNAPAWHALICNIFAL